MGGDPANLEEWLKGVSVTYALMRSVVPDDVLLDYSAESLERLGDVLHDFDEVPGFDDAAAAYLGQTLLTLAGGRWGWDDVPDSDTFGQPLAHPSDELGLTSVAPTGLVGSAAAMVDAYAEWERAAREYAAAHSDWRPVKEFTQWLDRPKEVSDDDRLASWLAQRERRFPRWVATYGAGNVWDFSPPTIDALSAALFRVTPTPEQFDDPGNADFVDGATWYLGETLRHAEPGQWMAKRREKYFRVRKHPDDTWSPAPVVDLHVAVRDGNPLRLHNALGRWMTPFVAKDRPKPEYRWTGAAWQTPLHVWVESIAGRVAALAAAAPDIAFDYSAESLRLLESFCRAAGVDPRQDLVENIAAYLGEALLRVGGGRWTLDDTPSNVSLGRPVIMGHGRSASGELSPVDLVLVACRWPDPGVFTRAHVAQARSAPERRTKAPTPGLDPAPAATVVESWCAARELEFPAWTARYGAGRTWDLSRDSLIDLTAVVLAVVQTPQQLLDPQLAEFVDGAAWYYGEILRRGIPSTWRYEDGSGLSVVRLEGGLGEPLGIYVAQQLRWLLERRNGVLPGPHRTLRDDFDDWVTAGLRQRAEEAVRRRNRKKSRREQSDNDYASAWAIKQARQFSDWHRRYGAQLGTDFSPESLDALESTIRQVTPTPEDLLDNPAHAEFLNVAAWYCGEIARRAADLVWEYDRDHGPDCYLRRPDGTVALIHPVEDLANTFSHYSPGSLRRKHDRTAASSQ